MADESQIEHARKAKPRRWRELALMAGSGITGVAILWIAGLLIPAETMLPVDVATVLVAEGCHGAAPHLEAARSPELSGRLVAVVIPQSDFGHTKVVDLNCEILAQRVRAGHPGMRLIPRRAICHRIQRWARAKLETAGRSFGQIAWLVDGGMLAKRDEYRVLTGLGIGYEELPDGGFRLVSIP